MKKTKGVLAVIFTILTMIGAVVFGVWIVFFVTANSFFKSFPIIYLITVIYYIYLFWYINTDMIDENNCFKLKFKAFIHFYEISDNIKVDKRHGKMYRPYYIDPKKDKIILYGDIYVSSPEKYYQILFSFIDWMKFEIWVANIKHQKKKKKIKKERKENDELVLSFLEQMKQDIEIHKQKAEEELEQAIDCIENIKKRT